MSGDLKQIKYLVIDVDGTMTDAGIYYDEHGNELKKFCTKDAAGFFAAKEAGIRGYDNLPCCFPFPICLISSCI